MTKTVTSASKSSKSGNAFRRGAGKKFRQASEKIDRTKLYPLTDAVKLAKETSYSKFDATLDMAINLSVDPRHADQNVRGATPLPHGLGKKVRIILFAKGDKAIEAASLGVEAVGGDELAEKIIGGWLDFDQVVATPDMMGVVGKLGKVLGPRGLMPNPKLGTVTFDIAKTVNELKAGRVEFRVDKAGIVHVPVGKVSFPVDHLENNIRTVLDALVKAKPSSSKGTYLNRMCLSATMGPGVRVDLSSFR
ncbi:MAG: 50S ribosomal protein L1 [Oligoflexales bacterium]|nr:50S ribosomal protein L1 [Oligoflexales bacterium]